MPSSPHAYLAPVNVSLLSSSPIQWKLIEGVHPYIGTFDIRPEDVAPLKAFASGGTPVTLAISHVEPGTTSTEWNFFSPLFIMDFPPAENPHLARVRLADRRWLWPYSHVLRRYNIRRKVGDRRIERLDGVPELEDMVDSVFFAAWSLRRPNQPNPTVNDKWTPEEILQDVFLGATRIEFEFGDFAAFGAVGLALLGQLTIDLSEEVLDGIEVENLVIDAPGDLAISQALAAIPGAKIYLTHSGEVVIGSLTRFEESHPVDALGPEIIGGGHVKYMDRSLVRPSEIRVLFTREHELRFDFIEPPSIVQKTIAENIDNDLRTMANVLPIPDFELEVQGRTLCAGTWITIQQALIAWGLPPTVARAQGTPRGALDYDILLKAFLPYQDIWAALGLTGQFDIDSDWPPRIAKLQQHFRRTFRINPRWWDRLLSIKASRLSVVDPVSGTRAPAEVYSDYCIIPGLRGFLKRTIDPSTPFVELGNLRKVSHAYFINVFGYPTGALMNNGGNRFTKSDKACPAEVAIQDPQQGIVSFQYRIDPYKTMEMILPSPVGIRGVSGFTESSDKVYPLCTPTRREAPVGWDLINQAGSNLGKTDPEEVSLLRDHKVAIVLSGTPASPNSNSQLYRVTVKLEDLQDTFEDAGFHFPKQAFQGLFGLVGDPIGGGKMEAFGPPMEVRVSPHMLTAMFAWSDSRAEDIERSFGLHERVPPLGHPDAQPEEDFDANKLLNGLCLNERHPALVGQRSRHMPSLSLFARAVAAQIYGTLFDRLEGDKTGYMNDVVEPRGWVSEVTNTLSSDGSLKTMLDIPAAVPKIDVFQYLSAGQRKLILNMVVDPKSL